MLYKSHPNYFWLAIGLVILLVSAIVIMVINNRRRRLAEAALTDSQEQTRLSEKFLKTVIDTIPECLMVIGKDRKIILANRHARQLSGLQDPTGTNRSCYEILNNQDSPCKGMETPCPLESVIETKSPTSVIHTRRDASGNETFMEITAIPIFDQAGEVVHVIESWQDITERRRLESELLQAQKMEAVGRLAGGVAHDFRNQLTVIKGYCDLLLQDLPAGGKYKDALEQIAAAADRATATTTQLLAFSRKQVLIPTVLDLNEVLAELHDTLSRLIGEHVHVAVICGPNPCTVEVDRSLLEQAIVNLCVNARDAMGNGGSLTLETSIQRFAEDAIHPGANLIPGQYVTLTVRDTGTGMDEATREHVFDPFFTTKEVGKGTGLGLSMVYGFVKQSGGHIDVTSEVGAGTTVRVYLPWNSGNAEDSSSTDDAKLLPRGNETILVVEDEEGVRQLVVRVLRQCGYTVFEAGDAREAMSIEGLHDGRIDLILADMVMPGTSGKDLADRLIIRRPDMKALFVSGYAEMMMSSGGSLKPGLNFLSKPFTPTALAQTVRRLLDRKPAGSASVTQ